MLRTPGSKKKSFATQEVGREMTRPYYLRNLHSLINADGSVSVLHKKKQKSKLIFPLVCNIMFTDNSNILFLKFLEITIFVVFLRQKVDGNMIFTDYWKVLVLIFLEMGNTAFFFEQEYWWKDDIYWLLKVLFLSFSVMKKRSFFESRNWWKYYIYWLLRSSCFALFGDGKDGLFSAKKLVERWYLLGIFELSIILQELGNMVFQAVKKTHITKYKQNFIWINKCKWVEKYRKLYKLVQKHS